MFLVILSLTAAVCAFSFITVSSHFVSSYWVDLFENVFCPLWSIWTFVAWFIWDGGGINPWHFFILFFVFKVLSSIFLVQFPRCCVKLLPSFNLPHMDLLITNYIFLWLIEVISQNGPLNLDLFIFIFIFNFDTVVFIFYQISRPNGRNDLAHK